MQVLSRYGMGKIQKKRMEGLPPDQVIIRVIKKISGKGMADIPHVNPYLMGSSCIQL